MHKITLTSSCIKWIGSLILNRHKTVSFSLERIRTKTSCGHFPGQKNFTNALYFQWRSNVNWFCTTSLNKYSTVKTVGWWSRHHGFISSCISYSELNKSVPMVQKTVAWTECGDLPRQTVSHAQNEAKTNGHHKKKFTANFQTEMYDHLIQTTVQFIFKYYISPGTINRVCRKNPQCTRPCNVLFRQTHLFMAGHTQASANSGTTHAFR